MLSSALAQAVTNELYITSITHQDGCTTLTWRSRPGEHYRVYWTDAMGDRPFWRVGAFCVPSGGTNTTWSEGCGGMQAMAPGGAGQLGSEQPVLTEEEKATRWAEHQARIKAGLEYLESKLKEAMEAVAKLQNQQAAGEVFLNSPPPSPGPPENNALESAGVTARFYRVARLPHGFVDGWGGGVTNFPATLTNTVALAASGRDLANTTPFVHNLALRCDGTLTATGSVTPC